MTKLEMASELLPMVISLQEKEVKIDIEVNNRDITICHWENDRIARSIGIESEEEFTKAVYYLKSL